ncbi:MAG TPA: hypothetical protein VLE74_01825 [Candidatus Saccharimonadales bacterium]|nr:hypothetical protein [Candidatus Saccharimonadales bacterium]
MKRIVVLGLSGILALPILSTAFVYAVDNSGSTTTTTTTETSQSSTDDTAGRAARLAKLKAELQIRLSAVEKLRLQTKCVASQGLISSIKGRIKGIETSRGEVYTNITTHLTDLSTKLKNKGVDTTALDADITTLKGDVTTFNTDLAAYKQAVNDLVGVDCKTDPEGFKAALQTARTDLDKVNKDAAAIRTYVNGTIKPLLVTIRAQLEPKAAGSQ